MSEVIIHEVSEYALPDFLARIDKLSKKSMKLLGKPITPVFHGDVMREIEINGRKFDLEGNRYMRRYHRVSVTGETPKIHGWTFVATIDHHSAAANLIRSVPGAPELPVAYRTAEPFCDHCQMLRRRNDTFILRCDADGSYKQIGRQCLRDFIGYDVKAFTESAKWLAGMEPSETDGEGGYGGGVSKDIQLTTYLAHTHAMIRKYGWVSKKDAEIRSVNSTASNALCNMFPPRGKAHLTEPLTERDYKIADEAKAHAAALTGRSDYEYNLSVVAQSDFIAWSSTGLAASMVPALFRAQEAVLKRAERLGSLKGSQHLGKVGERLRGLSAIVYGYRAFESAYGSSHLFRLRTLDNNILVWWASSAKELSIGDHVVLDGTVKKHDSYENINQTVLSRCKFTQQHVSKDSA